MVLEGVIVISTFIVRWWSLSLLLSVHDLELAAGCTRVQMFAVEMDVHMPSSDEKGSHACGVSMQIIQIWELF